MAASPVPAPLAPTPRSLKRKLVRRAARDRSQAIRHVVQWLFVVLNLWIGLQFFVWVRYCELGGLGVAAERPAGVEGWLPIAGLMNMKYFLLTGKAPAIHPAAMFLFFAFLLISALLKKAFCSWLCPIGTVSENLWKLGASLFRRNFQLPRWADLPLRSLKYILLAFFSVLIGYMSAQAIGDFMQTPYGLVVDVKMMNFFRDMGFVASAVFAALVLLSMLVRNFWCRYLCPYGALLGIASLFSPVRVRRDTDACIDCGKCSHACPSALPVDKLVQIRSVECTACMACVAVCPAQDALQFALPPRRAAAPAARWYRRALGPLAVTAVLAYIFFGAVLYARATNHWQSNIPASIYLELVSHSRQVGHPGF